MADLNTLNIQIKATTDQADKAIDKLITHLSLLNDALDNYSDQSKYVKGLKNLTTGLNGVADAVNSIDANKIKEVSKVIGSLASAGGKLSKMTFAQSFTEMGKSLSATERKIKEAVDSISKTFDISNKEGISALTDAVRDFYNASDTKSLQSAEDYLKDTIRDYVKLNGVLSDTQELYDSIRGYLSGRNITLPKGWSSEFTKSERGKLGIGNTSSDAAHSTNVATAIEEMNGVLGTTFDTSKAEVDILRDIVEYLYGLEEGIKKETQANYDFVTSSEKMATALDTLYEKFGKVREAIPDDGDKLFGAGGIAPDDFDDMPFADGFGTVETEARNADAAVKEVVTDVEQVKTELNDITVQNPFEGVINGIEALNGVSLDAEQFSGIRLLAENMGKLGGSSAAAAATILPNLAQSIETLNGVNIPTLEGVGQLAADLRSLGSPNVVRAAESLPSIITSLERFGTITIPSPAGLMDVANAVRAFGSAAAIHAAENIPSLAASLGSLMSTLAAAPVVNQGVIDLVNALAQLAANGSGAASILNALNHRTRIFGNTARNTAKHTKGLASTIGSIYAKFFLFIRAFRGIKKAIGYASDLTEVQNVVATTFGASTDKVQEFADTAIMSFGMSELSAKQFASRFQAMGSAMGVSSEQVKKASDYLVGVIPQTDRVKELYGDLGDSMADVSINLTKLTGDMASFYNLDYEDVAEDMQAVFTGMTRPLRKYGLDLTQATLKEWALANGLNADISKMSQAEKTMLRYQYVMSRMGHVMGDFNKTMDTWANVIRTIGQQFQKLGQIIGKGFISALKPILIKFRDFLNTFIDLAEKALNALGKLLGWQFEIEDVGTTLDDDMEDYNDSLDDAGDKAKKLKKMLLGIDELNLLPDNSDDDGGGGGGGGGGGLSGGVSGGELHLVPYDSDIDSWFEFGRAIADQIKEWLQAIDWEGYFKKAEEAGKNFAEFLNGLFDPEMFYEIGKAIANGLNTILHFLHEFAVEFDGTNFGLAIAAAINGFFENFDFKLLAETLNEWADKVWDAIKAALFGDENGEGGINWDAIWNGLKDFKDTIELDTIALIIGAVTIKKVLKWVFSGGLTKALGSALSALIKKDGGLDLGNVKTLGKFAVTLTAAAVTFVIGFNVGKKLGEALFPEDAEYYIDFDWGNFFESFKWAKDNGKLGEVFKEMLSGLGSSKEVVDFLVEAILGPLGSVKRGFEQFAEAVQYVWNNVLVPWYQSNVKPGFDRIREFLGGIWDNIFTFEITPWVNIWEGIKSYWEDTVQPWFENTLIGKIVGVFTNKEWQDDVDGSFEDVWTVVQEYWNNNVDPWFKNTLIGRLISLFTDKGWQDDVSGSFDSIWDVVMNLVENVVLPWFENTFIGQIVTLFLGEGWKSDISGSFEGMWNTIMNFGETVVLPFFENTIIGRIISGFKELLNFDFSSINDKVKGIGGGGSAKGFAAGGYPTTGSLFIANEAGPEMVGTIGNRTAVVNNGQIVESIKAGVYEAMASAMANGGSNVSVVLEGDTASFFSAIVRENNREIMRTGKSRLRN